MSDTTTTQERRREQEHGARQRHRGDRDVPGRSSGEAEGVEVSALARHRDPSARRGRAGTRAADADRAGRGVTWVRPSDLMVQAGGRIAGAGISFEAELARRARRAPVSAVAASRRAIRARQAERENLHRAAGRDRASRLPELSEFGQSRRRPSSWVTRSGIGLG
ncbi:hypothetical protein PFZ49_02320 [Microbacterium lacticum]|uniref:hypothetical protein n=1 Tax=Microbacterium lacticum TaxID=33885 RepID=UPI003A890FCF